MPAITTVTNNTTLEVLIPGPQGEAGDTPTAVSQADAEAGVLNTGLMTPLRTAQAISAQQRGIALTMAYS
jgi:hypothetical protein